MSHSPQADSGRFVNPRRGRGLRRHILPRDFEWSARLVDVGSVFYAVGIQDVLFDIEGEEHPVVASACGAESEQFAREGLAQPVRIIGQDASDEFDEDMECIWRVGFAMTLGPYAQLTEKGKVEYVRRPPAGASPVSV